ncbi:MAG: hypothetical protein WCJ35_20850 [Planctomycetota bacterium]
MKIHKLEGVVTPEEIRELIVIKLGPIGAGCNPHVVDKIELDAPFDQSKGNDGFGGVHFKATLKPRE